MHRGQIGLKFEMISFGFEFEFELELNLDLDLNLNWFVKEMGMVGAEKEGNRVGGGNFCSFVKVCA